MPHFVTLTAAEIDQLRAAADARDDAQQLLDLAAAKVEGVGAEHALAAFQDRFHRLDREHDDVMGRLVDAHRTAAGGVVVGAEVDYQTRCLTLTLDSDDDDDDSGVGQGFRSPAVGVGPGGDDE